MSKHVRSATIPEHTLESLVQRWWQAGSDASESMWLYEETALQLIFRMTTRDTLGFVMSSSFGKLFGTSFEVTWRQHPKSKTYQIRIVADTEGAGAMMMHETADWLPLTADTTLTMAALFIHTQWQQREAGGQQLVVRNYHVQAESSSNRLHRMAVWSGVKTEGGNNTNGR